MKYNDYGNPSRWEISLQPRTFAVKRDAGEATPAEGYLTI